MLESSSACSKRWLYFFGWALVSLILFFRPLLDLGRLAWQDDTASHILLIPFISAWLIYAEKGRLRPAPAFSFKPAFLFIAASLLMILFGWRCDSCSPHDRLSVYIFSLILLLIGGFVCFLGAFNAKNFSFALAFLLFAVPIPEALLNKVVYGLQAGSAAISELLFNLSGVPVLREGFVFHLPNLSIEVAQECSGIRSSLALLILALLVAHFSFRPVWKKIVFVIAGLLMMLVKNGIRIATLTLLSMYVDPGFLTGRLHHQGGVVFFLIGLGLLWPLYWYLRRGESGASVGGSPVGGILPAEK